MRKVIKIRLNLSAVYEIAFLVVAALVFFSVSRAALLCSVGTSCADTTVFRMSALITNAHAELATSSAYIYLVCCSGVTGLGTNCTGTATTVVNLSGLSQAHVEQGTQTNYANPACLSVSGGSVSVGYQSGSCSGYDTIVASMSTTTTNAHVGDGSAYTYKICASAVAAVASLTVSDGVIDYGVLQWGSSSSTLATSSNDTQTVTNNGTANEDFNIKGANSPCPWALSATAGSEQYSHEFSTNIGASWLALTKIYQPLATGVPAPGSVTLDLKVTAPTYTTCLTSQTVPVILQAVVP